MSDIFVSYDDLDRARVRRLVETLEARGWSVWWDHRISAGDAFADVIERELGAASCVIVAWTHTSVDSDWVRAEANEAWKRGKLVPVLLDRVDPPMPFGQIHAADLVEWDEEGHAGFSRFVADLARRIGRQPALVVKPAPSPWYRGRRMAVVAGAALLLVVALAFYAVSPGRGTGSAAAESSAAEAEGSTSLARGPREDAARGGAAMAGHWQAPVTYPDGATFEERFKFEVAEGSLSGTASLRGYGNRRGVLDGAVEGDRLSFRAMGQVQLDLFTVRDVSYRYVGLLEGDTLRFTVVEEGTGDPGFGFTAHRITAEEANRIATGGIHPRLSGMSTNNLYRPDYVRAMIGTVEGAMSACYEAAEYDEVSHEFVNYDLRLSASGALEQMEMRPSVASLERCMRDAFAATRWGPTETGEGGTMQLGIDARLPWNP